MTARRTVISKIASSDTERSAARALIERRPKLRIVSPHPLAKRQNDLMSHEVSFEVAGWPPIKNEAKSLLSSAHPKAKQVLALLEAADAAKESAGWECTDGLVTLQLVVRSKSRPPGDATNYLGGVADVLQVKRADPTLDIGHLGEFVDVALYVNDRQINRISYAEETAEQTSYLVRLTPTSNWPDS